MKRVFSALLALVLCLSFCACGALNTLPPVPTAETVIVPTEAPEETEAPAQDEEQLPL